jgi:sigma-E factor negative regulatory protein RseA
MSQPEIDRSSTRRILSALADGDATDREAAHAFEAWREDADARATWHSYQLIGDVLRSEDLACEPAADADFLAALRVRLAAEPVVLAPQAKPAEPAQPAVANGAPGNVARLRSRWQGPMAMAAGFVAMLVGVKVLSPAGQGVGVVASTGAPASAVVALAAPAQASASLVATSAKAKADADQLAPYLAAHRQSAMNGAFQLPGGDLRNVSLVQPAQ